MFEKTFSISNEKCFYYIDMGELYFIQYPNFLAEYCFKHNLKIKTTLVEKIVMFGGNGTHYNIKKKRFKKVKFRISFRNYTLYDDGYDSITIKFKTKKQLDEFTNLYLKYKLKL